MPPLRTMPAAKPVKTERTHEENQERAYIAASRRSDRSLEARIESARRASEIHKRRTGRSLRVTEADVINEEMYEEEDDDLPMQYRRLTAHLQTSNAHFDRRLAAFLTNQVAMRTALGQAVSESWQQPPNQYNGLTGQFMNPESMQMQQAGAFQNPMLPPQMMNRSPVSYRQSPYPVPNAQANRNGFHGRSASIATPQEFVNYQQQGQQQHPQSANVSPVDSMKPDDRRMSLPAQNMMPQTPQSQAQPSDAGSPAISRNTSTTSLAGAQQQHPYFTLASTQQQQQQPTPPAQQTIMQRRAPGFPSPFSQPSNQQLNATTDFGPLSVSLPMESQQLLTGAPLNLDDPMVAAMMPSDGGYKTPQPFYSYKPNGKVGGNSLNMNVPVCTGMNQTLVAPSMLDTQFTTSPESASADSVISPFTNGGFGYNGDGLSMFEPGKDMFSSGNLTPGDGDWQGFLVSDAWDEQPVA